MFVTNWISTTKIQKNIGDYQLFRHYFLFRTEVNLIEYFQCYLFEFFIVANNHFFLQYILVGLSCTL